MDIPDTIVLLLASVGAIQSFFLAAYIFSLDVRKAVSGALLCALFFALATRVTKSLLWAYWSETPLWVINLGFAAHAAAGPLLFLYMKYYVGGTATFRRLDGWHFLPAAAILLFSFTLSLDDFWYRGAYAALLYYQLGYVALSPLVLFKGSRTVDEVQRSWLIRLWFGVAIWGFAYFSNYILGLTSYLLGPVLYSAIIYALSFYGFKNQRKLLDRQPSAKYKNLNVSSETAATYRSRIIAVMESEKPYLDPDFSLTKLAELTLTPPHILSHILNDEIRQSFSGFVNSYRIREAERRLQDPASKRLKIASIALDCGFNSLSAFNTAFRKYTGFTPSRFRERV